MVICDSVSSAIKNQDYSFDAEYFKRALHTLNQKPPHALLADNIKQGLADDLKSSGNKILEYIGKLIESDMSPAAQVNIPVPDKVKDFNVPIIKDNHHDFSVENTRCYPKITQCLENPQHPHNIIDANASFLEIKDSYNIHDINIYNLDQIEYYIEDTNSTIIKNKINLSGNFTKMNLIANVLDSAGCKFCCDKHNYESIPLELELYILNLGYIFYQSYFNKLSNSEYYIYFMISLMDTDKKKDICENKIFKLNLYTYKRNNPGAVNPNIKEFILSNNRNFSVPNVCKTLKSNKLTGLANELNEYFNNEFTDIPLDTRNEILTTVYISGKGFGDFGQVFSVSCLYYYTCPSCPFKGNCILTTIDTFLFIIAILLGCPIIIGTPKFGYISIDDFLKYKEKSIKDAHNEYNKPRIYKEEDVPDHSLYLCDKEQLKNDLNTEIRKVKNINQDEYTITGVGNNIMGDFIGMALYPKKVLEEELAKKVLEEGFVFSAPSASGVSAFQGLQKSEDTVAQGVSEMEGVSGENESRVPAFQGLQKSEDPVAQGVSEMEGVSGENESDEEIPKKKNKKNKIMLTKKNPLLIKQLAAQELFNVFIKSSLNHCKKSNNNIHIYFQNIQGKGKYVLKKFVQHNGGGFHSRELLIYDDYFDNKHCDAKYTDNELGRELLKSIRKHTLYTEYFNFKNYINYIYSNYYIEDIKKNTFLKIILYSLETNLPFIIYPEKEKDNIFFVLYTLSKIADNVIEINKQNYDKSKPVSSKITQTTPVSSKKSKETQSTPVSSKKTQSKPVKRKKELTDFLTTMMKDMVKTHSPSDEFKKVKDDILSAWKIEKETTITLRSMIVNASSFINSCDPRYKVSYTFIGDIQTFIKNLEKIVYIIMETIKNIEQYPAKKRENILNLNTFIELFNLYRDYLLHDCFKFEVKKIQNIILRDIETIDNIIIVSWNKSTETVKAAFVEGSKKQKLTPSSHNPSKELNAVIKDNLFKKSVIVSNTLDEADKIYKKWSKLILPDKTEIRLHPIARDFWSWLVAFRDLNCKFASIKSYSEQYTLLQGNINVISKTMDVLRPLLNSERHEPNIMPTISQQNLLTIKDYFTAIYLIFKGIKDGIFRQPPGQPPGQPLGQPPGQPPGQPLVQPLGQPPVQHPGQHPGQPSDTSMGNPSGNPSDNPSDNPLVQPLGQHQEQHLMTMDNPDNPLHTPSDTPPDKPLGMGGGITCVQPRLQQRRQSKKRLTQKGGLLSNEEISGYYRRKNISDVIVKERDKRINNIVKIIVENEKNAEEYSNTNVNISDECSTEICSNKCDPMIDVECSTQLLGRKGSKSGRRGKQLGDEIVVELMPLPSKSPEDASMGDRDGLYGGAIKLKENKKIILGKERCIYTKKGTKKEYIKYKNEYIWLKEFIKLKSIEQQSKTAKKTQAEPNATTANNKKISKL